MSLFAAKKQPNETVSDFIELDKAGIIYPYVAKKTGTAFTELKQSSRRRLTFSPSGRQQKPCRKSTRTFS